MCTELLPPGGYPTAVNKIYRISDGKQRVPSVQRGRLDPRNRLLSLETISHEDLVTSLRVDSHCHHQTSCDFSWGCVEENPVSDAMFFVASVTRDTLHKAI
jgi:hypothetical protein